MRSVARSVLQCIVSLSIVVGLHCMHFTPDTVHASAAHRAAAARLNMAGTTAAPAFTLHEEAAGGDVFSVELLLASGLDANSLNARMSTPLHLAVLNGHEAIANLLIDHGALLDACNEDGNTPLHAAVGSAQLECARLLLSRGANTDVVSKSGMRPMRVAAQRGDAAMMRALRDGGAEVDGEAAHDAFWAAVQLCETRPEGVPLAAEAAGLLHLVFDADMQHLLTREKLTQNVTCMQPAVEGGGYDIIDDDLLQLELRPGRACAGGECCAECSRVQFPTFASHAETDAFLQELQHAIVPPLHQFSLQK